MPSLSTAFLDALSATVPLSDAERAARGARLRERTQDRGEPLVREDDRCDVVAFVARGTVRVTVDGDDQPCTVSGWPRPPSRCGPGRGRGW